MLSTHLTAFLALTTLSAASVLPNINKREGSILKLAVTAVNQTSTLAKRQDEVDLFNTQAGTRYLISFSIGTPPQPVKLSIDTGSSDTWVNPTCSKADTTGDVTLCNNLPVFHPGSSSSLKDTGNSFDLDYGIGSAQGEFFKDTWTLGGASVTGQQFGVATTSSQFPNGLMGVGPGIELTGYPNIIDTLATEGFTQSRAFSLDLRSVDSAIGSIIFGGIDTTKYSGSLEKLPIIPAAQAPDKYDRYWIYLSSVGITKPDQTSQTFPLPSNPLGQPVFLDSGETLSRLPTSLVEALLPDFPSAVLDPYGSGVYQVDCSVATQNGTVDFGFGDTIIHVPFHDFIWQAGPNLCGLGVISDDSNTLLGDSFLRAAYVVYDQDNQNLHLANAVDCDDTNLIAISTGVNAVPSITGACMPGGAPTPSASLSFPSITLPTSSGTKYSNATSTPTGSVSSPTGPISTPTGPASTLSTVYATTTYTISSCAPTVTNCPYGKVTTDTISLYTTYCPVTPTSAAVAPKSTLSTVYATTTYTISSCAPTVTNCPYGKVTTDTISLYTTYCPVSALETPAAAAVTPLVVNIVATTPVAGAVNVYPTVTPSASVIASAKGEVMGSGTVAPYPTSAPAVVKAPAPSSVGTVSVVASATTSAKGQQYTGGAARVGGGWTMAACGVAAVVLLCV